MDSDELDKMAPIPPIRIFRPNPNLQIAFDTRTRTPMYVMERLTGDFPSPTKRRRPSFTEETSLPEIFRSRNSHFKNSGYDRGHMAPAADLQEATFTLTNVCPQDPTLNRSLWSQLEAWVRSVAKREGPAASTYVVTGPLWLPDRQVKEGILFEYRYLGIGKAPSLVSVPTHFFKVVVVVSPKGRRVLKHAAFVVPNKPVERQVSIEDFLVKISDVEAVVGMQFFEIFGEEWKRGADLVTEDFRNRITSNLLLLTAGQQSTSKRKGESKALLRQAPIHLCSDGSCRRK